MSFRRTDLLRKDPSPSRKGCQSMSYFQLAAMKLIMLAKFSRTESSKLSAAPKRRPKKSLMSFPADSGMLCLRLTKSEDYTMGLLERRPLRASDSTTYLRKKGLVWARTQLLSLGVSRSEASSKQ